MVRAKPPGAQAGQWQLAMPLRTPHADPGRVAVKFAVTPGASGSSRSLAPESAYQLKHSVLYLFKTSGARLQVKSRSGLPAVTRVPRLLCIDVLVGVVVYTNE
jgi:hypothetical protein